MSLADAIRYMNTLNAKRVILVVSGGIAAYKAPDVVRRFREAGAEVRVVMSPNATEFITPLTLQAVSGAEVRTALFDPAGEAAMGHIELARWADVVVIAPASADFLARLRSGLAEELGEALCLATSAPILAAPAMNQQMWLHPATQENITALTERGVKLAGPVEGSQACGDFGPGRMVEADAIVSAVAALFQKQSLIGCNVLITAGPTRESIDPVRYITNHSSGKMGYAIAAASLEAGATVTLITGPTSLEPPIAATTIQVSTAQEMCDAVMSDVEEADIFISTAAVADYRPDKQSTKKIKRDGQNLALDLVPSVDILRKVAKSPCRPFTVGFAAETDNIERNARDKLITKSLDMIAANDVGGTDVGFNTDENELLVIWKDGEQNLPRAPKTRIARALIDLITERFNLSDVGKD